MGEPTAPWIVARLQPGERIAWSQDLPRGAFWTIGGPLVGAGFAIAFAGDAVTDLPGRFEWLVGDVPEKLGVPALVLAVVGALSFVSLVARHAAVYALSGWIVTDRRLVRPVRFAPFLTKSWPLDKVRVVKVREKKSYTRVVVRIPARWGEDDLDIDARDGSGALLAALRSPAPAA